ncbi:uncharacterized protein LOC119737337 [Patiria miniata]|uniref:Uncharacterized protein n=1 Tax=Patiria miniata TaxID=46514 RepID=A0A914AVL5_PATMI|nr:uncharacterized protein LOC119737337 [Patiria miniata]
MCDKMENSLKNDEQPGQSHQDSTAEVKRSLLKSNDTAPSIDSLIRARPTLPPPASCDCSHKWCIREWSASKSPEADPSTSRAPYLRGHLPSRFKEISSAIASYIRSSVQRRRRVSYRSWMGPCDASVRCIRQHLLNTVPGIKEAAPKLALCTVRGWLNQLTSTARPEPNLKSYSEVRAMILTALTQLSEISQIYPSYSAPYIPTFMSAARALGLQAEAHRALNRHTRSLRFRRLSGHPSCRRRLFQSKAASV